LLVDRHGAAVSSRSLLGCSSAHPTLLWGWLQAASHGSAPSRPGRLNRTLAKIEIQLLAIAGKVE